MCAIGLARRIGKAYQWHSGRRIFASRRGRTRLCRRRSVLRSENIRRKPYRWLGLSVCLCRWRAAHPPQPLCRRRMYRRGIPPRPKSLSVRKKSSTSAWGRSTSSIRKTPERPDSAKGLPEVADAAGAAEAAVEAAAEAAAAAAEAAAEAAAAEAAAAVCRGEFAVSARLWRAPITLTDARSWPG